MYYHNGFWMRSRFEVVAAQIFDEMGLEYKYEVRIPGTNKYADFLINVQGADSCFFVELLGMTNDREYFTTNMVKISEALDAGLALNRDLLLIFATDKIVPDKSEIESAINLVMYNLLKPRLKKC